MQLAAQWPYRWALVCGLLRQQSFWLLHLQYTPVICWLEGKTALAPCPLHVLCSPF